MSKVCPRCGCLNIEKEPDDWYNEDLVTCMQCDMIFPRAELADATIFQCITASPEVLAPKFIYHIDYGEAGGGYVSTIVKGLWHTEPEAIAATAAKLKEVCNEW